MKNRAQFIVAHPCNPPYHTPMVELVPAPWTSQVCLSVCLSVCLPASHPSVQEAQAGARALMAEVGQGPVSLSRELPGFVLNRMQVEQQE